MHKAAWLLLLLLMAGCTTEKSPVENQPTLADNPTHISVQGIVQDQAVQPIAGATVRIDQLNLTQTTGPDGLFSFAELPFAFYVVRADAPEHRSVDLTVNPHDVNDLLFVLSRVAQEPYQTTVPFAGFMQCAAEYGIITPSCDSLTEELSNRGVPLPDGGSITDDTTEFDVILENGWKTVVVDVVFDLSDHDGLEALRATVSGNGDPNALTDYEQYGRFESPTSFSFHLQPGGEYDEGVAPMPQNGTALRINIYGQGHGWHATCDAVCLLGVGAAIDLSFELYVTTFYVEPAPPGWSILLP